MLGGKFLRRRHRARHHGGKGNDGDITAVAQNLGRPKFIHQLTIRHEALDWIERFLLKEHHRVGIADRGGQQAFDVRRARRGNDLEARHHHCPVFNRLRMLRAEARTAAIGRADHQRHRHLTAGHIARLGNLVGDDIPADSEKIGEHDLGDRLQPGHGRAHGGAKNGLFRNRRIAHTFRTEFLEQTHGRFEHAAGRTNIFAQKHHVFVAAHFLCDGFGHRLAIGQFRHAAPPSAQTSTSIRSSPGGGEALDISVASSTCASTSASMPSITSCEIPNSARRSR